MAMTKCGSCGSTGFEMKEKEIYGAKYRYNAIQCQSCGTVVTFVDFHRTAALLEDLARKLNVRLDG